MPYRIGAPLRHAVRDGAVAWDEAVRNARTTKIAGARATTGVAVGGMGLEALCAVPVSLAQPCVEGTKAATTKATGRMKATAATMETTAATMETTAATMETTTTTTMETAPTTMKTTSASAMARLGYVCERQPHECARKDSSECERNLFAANSTQHVFLHLIPSTLVDGGWEGRATQEAS